MGLWALARLETRLVVARVRRNPGSPLSFLQDPLLECTSQRPHPSGCPASSCRLHSAVGCSNSGRISGAGWG